MIAQVSVLFRAAADPFCPGGRHPFEWLRPHNRGALRASRQPG